jgi:hypothetical protein
MTRPGLAPLAAILILALAACPAPEDPPIVDDEQAGDPDCDNLDEGHCLFPFPSDFFREVGPDGPELFFGEFVLPSSSPGTPVDADEFRHSGGWSVITPIYLVLPDATLEGAPAYEDIDHSLSPSSRTVVVDAETGERMAHWAEFDHFAEREGASVIALRLARRLQAGTRYIVAVHGLVDASGAAVAPPPGFAALRDRTPSTLRGVGRRRDHYEASIFPVLTELGIERGDLQLAWDFTTDTEENVTGTLLRMRDMMLEAVGADGPEYTVEEVVDVEHESIAVMVRGIAHLPSFIDSREGQIRRIRRDADGNPRIEGFEDWPFEVQIPQSVMDGEQPGVLLQYGHGLLGRMAECHNDWIRRQADAYGYVLVCTNMQGMAQIDEQLWIQTLVGDLGMIPLLSEKPHQGLVNHVAIARMMRGRFAADTDERYTVDGGPAYDPEQIYYYGNSQGGTMGSVMMSIQTEITRGVVGIPGGAFAFLLTRSTQFEKMAEPLFDLYPDVTDFIATLGLAQVGFDRVDPINYVHRVTDDPFPGTPPHRILLQVGKEDGQVNNQVTDILARTADAALLVPGVRPVWGLTEVSSPHAGNTMVEYDFGRPDNPRSNYPVDLGDETDPHALVRRVPAAQAQIDHFFRTGEVMDFCGGPCVIDGM